VPNALIRYTQQAEQAGFSFALLADSSHPWGAQEHSPFVWSILGAPEEFPAIVIAAERACTAQVAGRIGAGLIGSAATSYCKCYKAG
jgi:hypothetical protein